jgi:hypothetical protein
MKAEPCADPGSWREYRRSQLRRLTDERLVASAASAIEQDRDQRTGASQWWVDDHWYVISDRDVTLWSDALAVVRARLQEWQRLNGLTA